MLPYDFRRTAVLNIERAGVLRLAAMKLTGHKTESVYRRYAYAIVSESDFAEGVRSIAIPMPKARKQANKTGTEQVSG